MTRGREESGVGSDTAVDAADVPYEPPTEDSEILTLLGGLKARRAPPPIDCPTTDGDLAAQYALSERLPPPRHATPTLQPLVVLDERTDPPAIPREPVATTTREEVPTVPPPRGRQKWVYMLVGAAAALALLLTIVAIAKAVREEPELPAMTTTAIPSGLAQTPPVSAPTALTAIGSIQSPPVPTAAPLPSIRRAPLSSPRATAVPIQPSRKPSPPDPSVAPPREDAFLK